MTELIKKIMKEIVDMENKKKVRSEVFQDMDLEQIRELIDCTLVELAEDTLMEISASKPVPGNEEDIKVAPENILTLDNLDKVSN